jgi:hypothetical protein
MTTPASRIGTIDWVDLSTPDVDAARTFYALVLGWSFESTNTPMGSYHIALAGGHQCAGLMAADPAASGPPQWTIFVRVVSLEETVSAVTLAGGTILAHPFDIPGGARVAVAADPAGAVFAVIGGGPEPAPGEPALRRGEAGAVAWCELLSRDPHAVVGFYDAVFGWQAGHGQPTSYTVFRLGRVDVGGLLPMPDGIPPEAPSHWMVYFHVPDVAAAAASAERAGGSIPKPATVVEERTFAVLADPAGVIFGVLGLSPTIPTTAS